MGCGFGTPNWKRQLVVEHKFDYIDVDEFAGNDTVTRRLKYAFLYMLSFKAALVFLADIGSIIAQFNIISLPSAEVRNPLMSKITPFVYIFCLVVSLGLFLMDAAAARRIVNSRDISFTFTNTLAYRYYAFKNYAYFCFFEEINDLKRTKDNMALFVFFRLRHWKRLLLVEAPKAGINIYTLLATHQALTNVDKLMDGSAFSGLTNNFVTILVMVGIALFFMSAISVLVAGIIYVPLICEIRGNIKEYCCHKVDKRIAELIARSDREKTQLVNLANVKHANAQKRQDRNKNLLKLNQDSNGGRGRLDDYGAPDENVFYEVEEETVIQPASQLPAHIPPVASQRNYMPRHYSDNSHGNGYQNQYTPQAPQRYGQPQNNYSRRPSDQSHRSYRSGQSAPSQYSNNRSTFAPSSLSQYGAPPRRVRDYRASPSDRMPQPSFYESEFNYDTSPPQSYEPSVRGGGPRAPPRW